MGILVTYDDIWNKVGSKIWKIMVMTALMGFIVHFQVSIFSTANVSECQECRVWCRLFFQLVLSFPRRGDWDVV